MYDFYPEWGPAHHRDEHDGGPTARRPRYWQTEAGPQRVPAMAPAMAPAMSMAGGPEARDADFDRPDDN